VNWKVVTTLVAALLAFAAMGGTAAATPGAPRILTPRDDQLVRPGEKSVPVAVAVPGGKAPTAELRRVGRRKGIPVRLRGAGDGVFRGAIPRRDLRIGRDHLFVGVGKGGRLRVVGAHFTVGRPRPGVVTARVSRAPGSGTLRVVARLHGATDLVARLNGRPVGGWFVAHGDRRIADLSASAGVRFGRNRLALTAFDRHRGDYRTLVRAFVVDRDAPLAGAGPDPVGRPGMPLRFDGGASRAGRGRLHLRWRIARAPRGSQARLRGAHSKHPSIVGGTPGRYRLALEATQSGGHGAGPDAALASAASPVSVDLAEGCQPADVTPQGSPVQTLVSTKAPRVELGEKSYPMDAPGQSFAQLVVVERCSLVVRSNETFGAGAAELEKLGNALLELPSSDIAIVSGGGGATPSPRAFEEALPDLYRGLASIGVEFGAGAGSAEALAGGDFSAVGVPGMAQGEATQLLGRGREAGVPNGDISGFLRLDSTGANYTFAWPWANLPFQLGETPAPAEGPAPKSNTIILGGVPYTEAKPAPSGFHLLWVEPASLRPLGQESVSAEGTGPATLAARLQLAREQGATVFLSSFGRPDLARLAATPSAPEVRGLAEVARELTYFGANEYAFAGLAGKGDYTFVGTAGSTELNGPDSGTELVQELAGTKSSLLVGTLVRNRQGTWVPGGDGSPVKPGSSAEEFGSGPLDELLSESHPFQPLERDEEMAAQRYIFKQLGIGGKESARVDPRFGLRILYWDGGSSFGSGEFEKLATKLGSIPRCKRGKTTESQDCWREFPAVATTLAKEFEEVALVKAYFFDESNPESIADVFAAGYGKGTLSFDTISKEVEGFFPTSAGSVRGETAGILNGSLTVGEGFASAIPVAGGIASGAIEVVQGANQIVESTTDEADGRPTGGLREFDGDVTEWADALSDRQEGALKNLETVADLIVGDPVRLERFAKLFTVPAAEGGFDLTSGERDELIVGLQRSLARFLYSTMVPVPVRVTSPFTGPFFVPPKTAGAEGVREVNVPVGSGAASTIRFDQDIAPFSGGLLDAKQIKKLFGPLPAGAASKFELGQPLGFAPEFFLSPAIELNDGNLSAGFQTTAFCDQDQILNYEETPAFIEANEGPHPNHYIEVPCSES
jgi:hypothetical protein